MSDRNLDRSRCTALLFGLLVLWSSACDDRPAPASAAPKEVAADEPDGPSEKPASPPVEAAPKAAPAPPAPPAADPLLHPELANETAPARYAVRLETTKGDIIIDIDRSWAPIGADRFYNLVRIGYFADNAFFRVVKGFMAQVGLSGQPEVNRAWRRARIKDDPVTQKNSRGIVTFATSGKDSRVNQFYINLADNLRLDGMGFAPIGKVRDMAVVDQLYSGYGEGAPAGRGPRQALVQSAGNAYLMAEFPELDYIVTATIVEP